MALIYEGNTRNLIKRNKEYIEQAKRYTSLDIENTVIAYWIDELGDRKKDLTEYLKDFLPSFKRWYSNGVSILGIGSNYDLIKSIENFGITIDRSVINFILGVSERYKLIGKNIEEDDILRMKRTLYLYQTNKRPINYRLTDKFEIPTDEKKISGSSSK